MNSSPERSVNELSKNLPRAYREIWELKPRRMKTRPAGFLLAFVAGAVLVLVVLLVIC